MPGSADIFARFPNDYFVETGTWHGDGVKAALAAGFSAIRSVELSEDLFKNAKVTFRDDPRVKLWWGASSDCLSDMLGDISSPATIWLDAHYSGGDTVCGPTTCPLLDELDVLKHHPITRHTILIDDVRLLGTAEFGVSLNEVSDALRSINLSYDVCLIGSGLIELGKDILVARSRT